MNIYKLTQTEVDGYDTYSACIVLAESEEKARLIHPNLNTVYHNNAFYEKDSLQFSNESLWYQCSHGWVESPKDVKVTLLAENVGDVDNNDGVILSSYHAG